MIDEWPPRIRSSGAPGARRHPQRHLAQTTPGRAAALWPRCRRPTRTMCPGAFHGRAASRRYRHKGQGCGAGAAAWNSQNSGFSRAGPHVVEGRRPGRPLQHDPVSVAQRQAAAKQGAWFPGLAAAHVARWGSAIAVTSCVVGRTWLASRPIRSEPAVAQARIGHSLTDRVPDAWRIATGYTPQLHNSAHSRTRIGQNYRGVTRATTFVSCL
jgi:hypothetical protein